MANRLAIAVALALGMLGSGSAGAETGGAPTGEIRLAQAAPEPPRRVVRARPRIEVYPGRLLHRECIDGYREVWRPYWGTSVVMPYMHCRWVRG